jgi:phenylpropionate dioxygenase-like ring-hydroxylating dioxygenase large terminal subunit
MATKAVPAQPARRLEGYIYNTWYLAGWRSDLDTKLSSVRILDESIVVFRTEGGQWVALEDLCPHKLAPLSLGDRIGDCLRCRYHGLKFAGDGRCVEIPGQSVVSAAVRVRTYPIVEKHGGIWIWMGASERSDESEVPDIIGEGDSGWRLHSASIDVNGSAQLLWDNLLDLSHIPFVHFNTLVAGDQAAAAAVLAGEVNKDSIVHDRGITVERWHSHQRRPAQVGDDRPLDEHIVTDFFAPGVLAIRFQTYDAGICDKYPSGEIPDEKRLLSSFACQVVTPVTETTCKIFYNVGSWDKSPPDPTLGVANDKAIVEDKQIIEAQQGAMRANPGRKPMMLSMDQNVVRFKAIMRRLTAQEADFAAVAD